MIAIDNRAGPQFMLLESQCTHLVLLLSSLDRDQLDRKCRNHPHRFCYISGNVILPGRVAKITDFVKTAYHGYFGVKLGDQDKAVAPLVSCKTCVENLCDWEKGKRKSMPLAVPMAWREGKDQVTDCYFCMTNLQGINHKNKHCVKYPDIPSAKDQSLMVQAYLF